MNYADMIKEHEDLRRENKILKDYCINLEQGIDFWHMHRVRLLCDNRLSESICDPVMKASTGC